MRERPHKATVSHTDEIGQTLRWPDKAPATDIYKRMSNVFGSTSSAYGFLRRKLYLND